MEKAPLTTGEIARYCHVTDRAVLKWVDEGKLKAYRTPGNHSRVSLEDFLKFLNEYNMPIPPELAHTNKIRVLIVDDDHEMTNAIRRVLLNRGLFEIDVAYDGFTAGKKFAEFRPGLILLDIKMPGMNGFEVCQQIRQDPASKDVKIVAVSGALDMDGVESIMRLGANDYLTKPFRNEVLLMKIERLLGIKQ
ncbi:MAG: response regulator [Candidatus Omnitrophica bacterium]|nr:response regulator [Candidatus Omnitrophota bacterium]